jgi:hypothetical protein
MKHHHNLFLLCQRGLTAILLVCGLGVGYHQNGLHEVQTLIHVICFVQLSRGEGLPFKTRTRDELDQFRNNFAALSFNYLRKIVESVSFGVQRLRWSSG